MSFIPPDANALDGQFVFTIKNNGTPNEIAELRYVAQGNGCRITIEFIKNRQHAKFLSKIFKL